MRTPKVSDEYAGGIMVRERGYPQEILEPQEADTRPYPIGSAGTRRPVIHQSPELQEVDEGPVPMEVPEESTEPEYAEV